MTSILPSTKRMAALGLTACVLTLSTLALTACSNAPEMQKTTQSAVEKATESVLQDAGEIDPLSLRRSTLIVRDMDRSLALYRDAIGMEIIYDNIIRRPHKTEERMQEIRLVFLKANNDFIGVLGLVDYEHNNPDHPMHTKPVRKEGFTPGNTVLLFNTTELDERWAKIESVRGVDVINGPTYTEYPSYDGTDVIRINVTRFYDPDGFLIEYNQPLDQMK